MAMTTPKADGYYMPGEFEPHGGCILIWPERPGSWTYGAVAARRAFRDVIAAIARSEQVYVAAGASCIEDARQALADIEGVTVFEAETDDAWARDVAPTFVRNRNDNGSGRQNVAQAFIRDRNNKDNANASDKQDVRCVNWEFNAWGGSYNGLYASWEKDNAFANVFANAFGYEMYDASPFVLEGGSVHSDGEGTILVTESCLLSAGRNPGMTKAQIEEKLCTYLGGDKVIWLPRGIYNDETDEHVDNICAFIRPGEVALAWTDRETDPQYPLSRACMERLRQERDARGRRLVVHKLPIPDVPICVNEEDLQGYVFEEGEDAREVGERLAASYVNFYFSNGAVILPAFGGENEESDKRAAAIMRRLCPEREVIAVAARDILAGGGNIHCITQQIPC